MKVKFIFSLLRYPGWSTEFFWDFSKVLFFPPLVDIYRQPLLKSLGLSAAAIGIGEEGEEDEKKAREGKCEIVFGSPESWLITKWQ